MVVGCPKDQGSPKVADIGIHVLIARDTTHDALYIIFDESLFRRLNRDSGCGKLVLTYAEHDVLCR
jgi:hypothetical protein